jgi:predicted transcriptional regulator
MNNWCICWFFTHIFTGFVIFKGLTARRLYKSFDVKGLIQKKSGYSVYKITEKGLRMMFHSYPFTKPTEHWGSEGE